MRVAPEIVLSGKQRSELLRVVESTDSGERLIQRARIVLLAASGMQNKDIAAELKIGRVQVSRWRERYTQLGLAGIERDLPRGAPGSPVDADRLMLLTMQARTEGGKTWSTRSMAAALGVSPASVSRHWRANGLDAQALPVLPDADPAAALDRQDVAALYVSHSVRTMVLVSAPRPPSGDLRALNRRVRKIPPGAAAHADGQVSTDLIPALKLLDERLGSGSGERSPHSQQLRLLRQIDKEIPQDVGLQVVTDNRAVYQNALVRKWLSEHRRFRLHVCDTPARWRQRVQELLTAGDMPDARHRGASNLPQLVAAILAQPVVRNGKYPAFIWTLGAVDEPLDEVGVAAGAGKAGEASFGDQAADTARRSARSGAKARHSLPGLSLRDDVTALKRERILQEAAKLFFEFGYLQTSVDAIAERLGATKPFVYYHFESKAEILVEICERSNRDVLAAAESAMSAYGSPPARLEQFLREFTDIALQQHQMVAIYFREELSLPEEAGARIKQIRKSINARLGALLSEGVRSGDFEIEDPGMGALVIAGMASYAFAWYREAGRLGQQEVTDRIVKMALKLVNPGMRSRPSYRVHSLPAHERSN